MDAEPSPSGPYSLEKHHVMQFGLWLVPESGGTYKSVQQFSEAVDSIIYSFTFPESLKGDAKTATGLCTHLLIRPGFLGRWYCVPEDTELIKVKSDFLNARLVISHCFWRWGADWIRRQALRCKIPYWIVCHGSLDPYVWSYNSLSKRVWFEVFGRRILYKARYVICATQMEKRKVLAVAPKSRCVVINWPVEPPPKPPAGYTRQSAREKLAIAPEARILLYLGRLHAMKRLVELVEVFASADVKNTQLLLVGPGEQNYRDEIVRKIEECGCADRVMVREAVYGGEKYELYNAVDGYISNSARENFGLAAAEAMAAALPVILSPGNDLIYDMEEVRCGWFLKTWDETELASALREFDIAPAGRLREMGEAGKIWTRDNLSFETFKARVRDLATESIRDPLVAKE